MAPEMYGILGTLLGVFIGSPVTYLFAKKLFFHQRAVEAGAVFREAFVDELMICEDERPSEGSPSISLILDQAFAKHKKAIICFRPFVSKKDLKLFDVACRQFTDYEERLGMLVTQVPGVGRDNEFTGLAEEEIRKIVASKIHRLISYAINY